MITKINIENFSGIKNLVIDNPKKRNILLYGPNGSGKSSIIDSIKYLQGKENEISRMGRKSEKYIGFHGCDFEKIKVSISINNEAATRKALETTQYSKDLIESYIKNIQILRKDNLLSFLTTDDADRYKRFLGLMNLDSMNLKINAFQDNLNEKKKQIKEKEQKLREKSNLLTFARLEGTNFLELQKSYYVIVGVEFGHYEKTDTFETLKTKFERLTNKETQKEIDILKSKIALIKQSLTINEKRIFENINSKLYEIEELKKEAHESHLLELISESIDIFKKYDLYKCPVCLNESEFSQIKVLEKLEQRKASLQKIIEILKELKILINRNELQSRIKTAKKIDEELFDKIQWDNINKIENLIYEITNDKEINIIKNFDFIDTIVLKQNQEDISLNEQFNKLSNNKIEILSLANEIFLLNRDEWLKIETELKKIIAQKDIIETCQNLLIESRDVIIDEIFKRIEKETLILYNKLNYGINEFDKVELKKLRKSSLQLEIDFFDLKKVDPGVILSSGHLDLLGLAMFLTTSKTFYPSETLIVLEDVINSNDNEHKQEVINIVLTEFNDFHFIVTTHLRSFYDLFDRAINILDFGKKWGTLELDEWDKDSGAIILKKDKSSIAPTSRMEFIKNNLTSENYLNIGGALRIVTESFLKRAADKKKISISYNIKHLFTAGDFINNLDLKKKIKKDLQSVITDAEFDQLALHFFGNSNLINFLSHDNELTPDLAFSEIERFVIALEKLMSLECHIKRE